MMSISVNMLRSEALLCEQFAALKRVIHLLDSECGTTFDTHRTSWSSSSDAKMTYVITFTPRSGLDLDLLREFLEVRLPYLEFKLKHWNEWMGRIELQLEAQS